MFNIAIDALAAHSEGALTYLLNLVPALIDLDSSVNYILISAEDTAEKVLQSTGARGQLNICLIDHVVSSPIKRIIWEHNRLNKYLLDLGADLLFCPIPPSPLNCSIPTVVALRNMAPYCQRFSSSPTLSERFRYAYIRAATAWSLAKASQVFLVSEASRDLISAVHSRDVSQLPVIYHGSNPIFKPIPQNIAREALSTLLEFDEQFILYPSPTWHYKNHAELIEAYAILVNAGRKEKLVLAGRTSEPVLSHLMNLIIGSGLTEQVIFLGNVDYELIPRLYSAAEIIAYPSVCEACPNIVLEALASGVPLAASNIPVVTEIAGNGAAYFDPFDPKAIATCLLNLLEELEQRRTLSQAALDQAKNYSWQKTAAQTLELFLKVASSKYQ